MHHLKYILTKERALGLFSTPNSLAGFLIFLLPLLFYFLPKIIKIFYIPMAVIVLYMTKSIGAWLTLASIILFVGAFKKKLDKRLFLFLVISFLFLFALILQRKELLFDFDNLYFNPFFQRFQIWNRTFEFIIASPFTGLGLGNFPIYYNRDLSLILNQTLYAHNILLQFWFEMGLLGLLWIVTLYILLITKAKKLFLSGKQEEIYLSIACLGFLLHNLIDFTFYLPQVGIIFWIGFALILKK